MTREDISNRTETGQNRTVKSKLPKTHVGYWTAKLKKRTYKSGATIIEIPTWQARIQHLGKEQWFNTEESNKDKAAIKARNFYMDLLTHGWDYTLTKHKPDMVVSQGAATVGEFLEQVRTASELKDVTFHIYAKKLRSLVAGVFSIDGGKGKFDYVNGGRAKWVEKVNGIALDRLTTDRVNKWKTDYLKTAGENPLKLKRARVSLNSVIRSSKALFCPQVLKHVSLKLPKPLPLDGVETPQLPKGQERYRSEIDPAALLQKAQEELGSAVGEHADRKREMFKIVLLAIGAGLRRDEIDTLQVRQILWNKNLIRVETTEHTAVKTDGSEADIPVDPALLKLLKQYLPDPAFPSSFVIFSRNKPRPHISTYHHYRLEKIFRHCNRWLKDQGITSVRAVHTLRKEFGSQLNAIGGLMAASQGLRHSSIKTTASVYVDQKPVVFPVGQMLLDDKVQSIPKAAKK